MRKIAILVALSILSLNTFAEDLGVGISGSVNSLSDSNSVNSNIGSQTNISVNFSALIGLQDGWEVGALFGISSLSYSDPNGVYNGEDGYNFTNYTFSVAGNKALFSADQLKVLMGGQAFVTTGSSNKQYIPSSGSNYNLSTFSVGFAIPIVVEYRLTQSVGIRVSNPLATFSYISTQYKYAASTTTANQTQVILVPTVLTVGVYYFF